MKLIAFRIQNYKKVRDSGWVTVRELTAFVGKNEAGKSALFRGLSKLNPPLSLRSRFARLPRTIHLEPATFAVFLNQLFRFQSSLPSFQLSEYPHCPQ